MKIYMDTCCFNRTLDDLSQLRVALEAEAILGMLKLCEESSLTLIASEVLVYEIQNDPSRRRRLLVEEMVAMSQLVVKIDLEVLKRGQAFKSSGINGVDALHLAAAERGKADIFCSCDDRLIKRAKIRTDLTVRPLLPLEAAQEIRQ